MIGQTVSHYRILRSLGAGGMGEVYLAEDTKLGRQVALKVLASETASDPDRRARFEREARAIAALNHPGIVTIHSVEEHQGLLFITMELVEGQTLAQYIPAAGMPLADLLKIAIPLADAVGTAHQRGIMHRDLKPANVMIGHDGRVKVLDFGLAKQQAEATVQDETELQPTAHATAEGKILGTVAYMSPEQAQGKPVDHRSDIFSLGVVLFEMATGQRPFKGDSSVSVLSSVLRDTPPLVSDLKPELPRELGRIIRHCLVKDPEERYQTAKDLRNDLKALKEDSDSGELGSKSVSSVTPVSAVSGMTNPPTPVPSAVMSPPRRRAAWVAAGVVVVAAAGSIAAWSWSAPRPPRVLSMKQITTDGAQKEGLLTDGARLYFRAFLRAGAEGRGALAQVAAGGGDTVELAPQFPSLLDIDPGGQELLVGDFPRTGDGVLEVMPVLGGAPRPVGDLRISGGATWTPDKSQIVFAQGTELRLASSDGSGSRTLLTAPGSPFAPRLSPDGERLRYSVTDPKTGNSSLWEASADGRDPHPLLPGWTGAQNPCCGGWTADGRQFVFEAGGNLWARAEARSLFRRTTDAPTQLTFGPLLFSRVIPGRDGKHLYAIGDQRRGRLARYDPKSHQFVEFLGGLSAEGVAISPDGEWVVYTTYPEYSLWRSRLDGSERRQLTFPPMGVFLPRWSPDGSQIVFFGGTSPETYRIYLLPATGGVPRLATKGTPPEADPSWSPDGRALVFGGTSGVTNQGPTPPVLQRLDVATGRLAPIPGSQGLFSPRWSPDGRWIVALSRDSGRLVIFDVASERWSDLLPAGPTYGWPSWSADSKEVTFVRGLFRENAIVRVRLADRKVETVFDGKGTDLVNGALGAWFGSTPDGSPLELFDAGTHDIYALDWDAP